MSRLVDGVKVIHHNAGRINEPDDPSLPYRLDVALSPPTLMEVAFTMLHGGSETLVIRGESLEALNRAIKKVGLRDHSRLISFRITGPKGVIEEIKR